MACRLHTTYVLMPQLDVHERLARVRLVWVWEELQL